jgi:hypothetical protein
MTFITGQSGNEKGRPKGITDKRSRFRKLIETHAEELIEVLIRQAKSGDPTALRLCIERLIPKAKSEPVTLTLPDDLTSEAVVKLGDQILRNIANQEITIDEGGELLKLIQTHLNIVGMSDLLKQYTVLSEQLRKYQEGSPLQRANQLPEING